MQHVSSINVKKSQKNFKNLRECKNTYSWCLNLISFKMATKGLLEIWVTEAHFRSSDSMYS